MMSRRWRMAAASLVAAPPVATVASLVAGPVANVGLVATEKRAKSRSQSQHCPSLTSYQSNLE